MLARLLCRENIEIREGDFQTASFDTKNRILRLPQWNFDEEAGLLDMVIGHEISHALHTDNGLWLKWCSDNPRKVPVLNIIEDIRIERMIQNLYPGLIRPFREGRAAMFESDLFDLQGKDPNTFGVLDRINIRAKLGDHVEVDLSAKEQEFYDRCERAETMEEVILLADEAAGMMADEQQPETVPGPEPELSDGDPEPGGEQSCDEESDGEEQEGSEQLGEGKPGDELGDDEKSGDGEESSGEKSGGEESGDEEKTDGGESGDEEQKDSSTSKTSGDGPNPSSNPEDDFDFSSHTQKKMDEFLEKARATGDPKTLHTLRGDELIKRVIPFEEVKQSREYFRSNPAAQEEFKQNYKKFQDDNKNRVTYMVNEFNRKKAAFQYSRSTEARTGRLNLDKLHQYKIDDNIFQSVTQLADAKNHGMVMFIDYSGSMGGTLNAVIRQTAVLVLFCKKVGIPFEVYGFTSGGYENRKVDPFNVSDQVAFDQTNIFELVSSRLNKKAYEDALIGLVGNRRLSRSYYSANSTVEQLGATPLDETIIIAAEIIERFQKKYRIQKTNVIFLTDGDANGIGMVNATDRYAKVYKTIQWRGKQFELSPRRAGDSMTSTLFAALKGMVNCTLIGYRLGSKRILERTMNYTLGLPAATQEALKVNLKKDKCAAIADTFGYDMLFLIRDEALEIAEDGDDDDDAPEKVFDMNDKKAILTLRREFMKSNRAKQESRVFLNKFTEIIA